MKKYTYAFTLTEILIVITIIAIISAIVFPAYLRQRAKTQATTCLSNIKNQGMALRIYIEDNDGYWPTHTGLAWHINKNPSLVCPDFIVVSRNFGFVQTGYGFNGGFVGLPPVMPARLDNTIKFPAMTVAIAEVSKTEAPEVSWDVEYLRGTRHNGGGNFVFCDGHAKWYMPDAVMGLEVRKPLDGTFPAFANQSMDEVAKEGAQ